MPNVALGKPFADSSSVATAVASSGPAASSSRERSKSVSRKPVASRSSALSAVKPAAGFGEGPFRLGPPVVPVLPVQPGAQ